MLLELSEATRVLLWHAPAEADDKHCLSALVAEEGVRTADGEEEEESEDEDEELPEPDDDDADGESADDEPIVLAATAVAATTAEAEPKAKGAKGAKGAKAAKVKAEEAKAEDSDDAAEDEDAATATGGPAAEEAAAHAGGAAGAPAGAGAPVGAEGLSRSQALDLVAGVKEMRKRTASSSATISEPLRVVAPRVTRATSSDRLSPGRVLPRSPGAAEESPRSPPRRGVRLKVSGLNPTGAA
jgi:hypothetical protein